MQIIETQDAAAYNSFVASCGASALQSWEWGEFQKRMGRKVWRIMLSSNTGKLMAAAQIVKMPLPRNLSYFYCPRGPIVLPSPHLSSIWQLLLDKIQDFVVVEKPIFLRIDPLMTRFSERFNIADLGFSKIPWEVQPRTTLLLDLHKTEEQLLHGMKPKTRYNINLSMRRGVSVEQLADGKKIKIFWEMMMETTARDQFSAHPYLYYFNLAETLGKSGTAELLLASYQRRPLAGAIVSHFAGTSMYLHGASTDRMKNIMAPYLVQWAAIKSAKAHGSKYYDFGGAAPERAGADHPWAGITRFKRGFGGDEVSYVGAFDLPYNKWWYWAYKIGRKLRRSA